MSDELESALEQVWWTRCESTCPRTASTVLPALHSRIPQTCVYDGPPSRCRIRSALSMLGYDFGALLGHKFIR